MHDRSCETVRDLISLEMDGEIPADQQQFLESHLDICSDCRRWSASLHDGVHSLKSDVGELSGELDSLIRDSLNAEDLLGADSDLQRNQASEKAAPVLALSAFAILVLIAVTSTLLFDFGSPNRTPVGVVSGFGEITRADGLLIESNGVDFNGTMKLMRGDTIVATEGGVRVLEFLGEIVDLDEGTILRYQGPRLFEVLQGKAEFSVPSGGSRFVVKTQELSVEVVGTKFSVQRWSSKQQSEVRVQEGQVMIQWGKRIPLPVVEGEWVEVNSSGFMFHSVPRSIERDDQENVQRPAARIGKPIKLFDEESQKTPRQLRREKGRALDLPSGAFKGSSEDEEEDTDEND
ncbi:MAG: FecR domain-containing protein [Planctomycetota bacterium]|nr:FecR domain-containing protein [Planctomycetota bacterium]MDG2085371.1 FecR domain-containing protein [Planctomycetota bacterium]